MNDLEQIRQGAVGLEVNEELLKQYPVEEEREIWIPTRHGEVRAFFIRPFMEKKQGESLPVVINLHGGGFVKGYRGQDVVYGRILAVKGKCLVFNMDYHPAPEQKYPHAIEEAYDFVQYVREHADTFRADISRMVLSGQSAGGNIVTAVTFMLKHTGKPLPNQVILSYPPFDLYTDPGARKNAEKGTVSVETGRKYIDWYIDSDRRKEIYASPVFAEKEELEGLPPFVILMAEKDGLVEEEQRMITRLLDAGVQVTARKINGASHGFVVRRAEGCEAADEIIFTALKECFYGKNQEDYHG